MKIKKSSVGTLVLIIISIFISLFLLKLPKAPYVFIGILWFTVILFISLRSKRSVLKFIGFNLCAVILALSVAETYQWFKTNELFISRQNRLLESNGSNDLVKIDKFLGYAPPKNCKILESKFYKNKTVYDVTYTIDKNGLRISPPCDDLKTKGCILFFGGSFTFGAGVNDRETMPYQVGEKLSGKYCIYNFGFGGYGPHQMLSELQHNIVKNIVKCKENVYAIYQAIPDHINRAAGLDFWDLHGPRYIVDKFGKIKYTGHFDEANLIPPKILKYLNKSLIYRDIIGKKRFFNRDKDLTLYINIVLAAREKFEKLYPGGKFHVIYWDNRFKSDEKPSKILETSKVLESLKNKGVKVHLISDIIPDYMSNRAKYNISPYDAHPNATANQLIADYVINNILKR